MTLATVNSWIKHANTAIKRGDCATAQQSLEQAWAALGAYSAQLAKRGASPSSAVSAHKAISKALVAAGKRCGVSSDGLMPPSGARSGMNPDLMPPSGMRTGQNPDLLAPSFGGPGDVIYDSITTTLVTLGIAGATIGLGIGLYTVFHKT